MSTDDRSYFLAAGASLAKAQEIIAQRKDANARRDAFKRRLRAKNLVESGTSVVAAVFKKDPPAGWIPFKRFHGSFAPSRRSAEGRKLLKEMEGLSWMSDDSLGSVHFAWNDKARGMCFYQPHLEPIGDQYIISQHSKAKTPPADAIPLKHSEYWRMKEEAEAPVAYRTRTGGSRDA